MIERNKFTISTDDNSAIITHYLQNVNTKYSTPFEKDALDLLYCKEDVEQSGMVKEPDPQYNLFPELFSVPFPAPEKPKFTFIDLLYQ